MKRDDFGMRIDEVRELATKYSKPELARMVQMGLIPPQQALMAGMMIDRIAKSAMQPPTTTVAEDVLAPQQPTSAQAGIMAAPGAPAPSGGVATLPSGLQNMAGGGIVAFAGGDLVQGTTPAVSLEDLKTGKMPIYTASAPEQMDLEKAAQRRQQAEQQAGLDPRFFEKLRSEVTGDKEDFAKQREEAKYTALMNFGLGLMGARKGQEFQTASAAGKESLAQYGAAVKDIRAQEKEMKKTLRDLSLAEQNYKKSNSDKDLAAVQRYEDQLQAHKENIAAMTNKAVQAGTTANVEIFKVDEQKATQLALEGIRQSGEDRRQKMRLASAGMGSVLEAQAILKELQKENPKATITDAYQVMKGAGKLVTNPLEMQEKYADDWSKMDYLDKKKYKDQGITDQASYVAYRIDLANRLAEKQKSSTATGGPQQGEPGSAFSPNMPTPKSADELSKLPKGTKYVAPDGSVRIKQ